MRQPRLRRRSSGFTYIEVTAAFTILVIGVLGFAGTVVYTRNLDRRTTTLWRASTAASDAMEDVRQESAQDWSSINSTWDGTTVRTQGAENAVDGNLRTTVGDDPTRLDSGSGMWEAGAVLPNFYHVAVRSESDDGAAAGSIDFQTYVADRSGFRSLVATPYVGLPPASSDGSKIEELVRNVVISGAARDCVTFQVMNGSSVPVRIASTRVQMDDDDRFVRLSVNGVDLYNDPARPKHAAGSLRLSTGDLEIAPGLVDVAVGLETGVGEGSECERPEIHLHFRFTDGSEREVEVHP